jgi:L-serine dehydratase
LSGELPEVIAPESIEPKLSAIRGEKRLRLAGSREIGFDEGRDLLFHKDQTLPFHSNGMRYRAFDAAGSLLREEVYFSIGGGFILREGEAAGAGAKAAVKYPFNNAADLLATAAENKMTVWEIALENEKAWHTEEEIRLYVRKIWCVMQECM